MVKVLNPDPPQLLSACTLMVPVVNPAPKLKVAKVSEGEPNKEMSPADTDHA